MDRPGENKLGVYLLIEEIGSGAMGVVFKAIDNIDRVVAVKVVRMDLLTDVQGRSGILDRFKREAKTAGNLKHAGIVTIYYVGEHGDLAYIVMEYIDGQPLETLLSRPTALTKEKRLDLLRQAAEALDFAHSRGVIHRDVKPSNIMVTSEGEVKICDFGIAKNQAQLALTQTGMSVGTPLYMSPEQHRAGPLTGASDQYSLAVIAYRMLTGTYPFASENLANLIFKVVDEPPPPASLFNPSLSEEITAVLNKALAKKPPDRFETCDAFIRALSDACRLTPEWTPSTFKSSTESYPMREIAAETTKNCTCGNILKGGAQICGFCASFGPTAVRATGPVPEQVAKVFPVKKSQEAVGVLSDPNLQGPQYVSTATPVPGWSTTTPVDAERPGSLNEPMKRWRGWPLAIAASVIVAGGLGAAAFLKWAQSGSAAPVITATPPPAATLNEPYKHRFAATGGNSPYTWSVPGASPPPGTELDQASGQVTGVPTSAGRFRFIVRVGDLKLVTADREFEIEVRVPPPAIASEPLPPGGVGTAYSHLSRASGGTAPYEWSVSGGSLPPGIGLDASSGALSGHPTSDGAFRFTLRVTDASRVSVDRDFIIDVKAAPPVLSRAAPHEGAALSSYSFSVGASLGKPPYSWRVTRGTLPAGLQLDSASGAITGIPQSHGESTFTLRVVDRNLLFAESDYTIKVNPAPLAIPAAALPSGKVGTAYSARIPATGGAGGYRWSVARRTLPPGLALDSAQGLIGGAPRDRGTFSFTVRVVDSGGRSANGEYKIEVAPQMLNFATASLSPASVDAPYGHTFTASGGVPPYRWSIRGSKPAGFELDEATGRLTGRRLVEGKVPIRVVVTDSARTSVEHELVLDVRPGSPSITTRTLPATALQSPYSQALTATRGSLPYSWSIVAGRLPAGINLNQETGTITGRAQTPGAHSFTARVTDVNGLTADREFSLEVKGQARAITTATLPPGTVRQAYSHALAGTGGTGAYRWSVSAGELPPGLTLDPDTGTLRGIPIRSGTFELTVRLTDTLGVSADRRLSFVVNDAQLSLKDYSGPSAGTITWSGQLDSSGRVTIDRNRPSPGTRGSLPGVPVDIIEVVPSDTKVVDPPSQKNQWSVLVLEPSIPTASRITIRWRLRKGID